MANPIVVHWKSTAASTGVISLTQDYSAAGYVIFNPVLTYPVIMPDSCVRTLSFTSTQNLSGVNITIVGFGSPVGADGNPTLPLSSPITEVIAGPSAGTVYSANIYSKLTSIHVSGPALGLSVGLGSSGITVYKNMDYNRVAWYASFQTALYNRVSMTHTIYVSNTKPYDTNSGDNIPYPQIIPAFSLGTVDDSENQLIARGYPLSTVWVTIKGNAVGNANEELYFTIVQQSY